MHLQSQNSRDMYIGNAGASKPSGLGHSEMFLPVRFADASESREKFNTAGG